MLECLVQEYAWMGWGTDQLLALFRHPAYPALNALLGHYGEAGVRRRVAAGWGAWGRSASAAPSATSRGPPGTNTNPN